MPAILTLYISARRFYVKIALASKHLRALVYWLSKGGKMHKLNVMVTSLSPCVEVTDVCATKLLPLKHIHARYF